MTWHRLTGDYVGPFVFGAVLVLLFAMWVSPGGEADWAWELWDEANPVVTAVADTVERDGDAIHVHIIGEKLRACHFNGVHAYSLDNLGRKALIGILRLDRPVQMVTRPLGVSDFGRWKIWPVTGAITAEVWVTYRCASRIVLNRLVEVKV